MNTLICLIFVSILFLLIFTLNLFLAKIPGKGKTMIKWKVAFNKIFQIKFECEHDNYF